MLWLVAAAPLYRHRRCHRGSRSSSSSKSSICSSSRISSTRSGGSSLVLAGAIGGLSSGISGNNCGKSGSLATRWCQGSSGNVTRSKMMSTTRAGMTTTSSESIAK